MSGASQEPWHGNPNAPKISSQVYFNEKTKFAGMVTCAIFYGIVVVLFFRCVHALINPVNRARGGIKWLLVIHTVAIFLFVTVFTVIVLDILSNSYIDNREARGSAMPPGPLGYQYTSYSSPIGIISTGMFLLNNLLVDGLLLYRCYIMYAMIHWVIIFPCLLYLATCAMAIVLVYYQISQPNCTIWRSTVINLGVPSSISVSLDVLLTLMIIARLVLLSREIRKAMNAPFRIGGLYKAVITILCESSAIYAVTFLLWIGAWAAGNPTQYFFFPILTQTQVIAPFLICAQVANRRAMTGDVVTADIPSIPSSRGESTGVGGTPSSGHSVNLAVMDRKTPDELSVKVVTTIDLHHDQI